MIREYILDNYNEFQNKISEMASLQVEYKRKRVKKLEKEIGDKAKNFANHNKSLNEEVVSNIYTTAYFYSEATQNDLKEPIRSAWKEKRRTKLDENKIALFKGLGLNNEFYPQQLFPNAAWQLRINFELIKPYLSRNDQQFYIIENPVRKEWVFKAPYIAPSQWKGMLRAAMINMMIEEEKENGEGFADRRLCLSLLFGDEKGEIENNSKDIARYLDESGPTGAKELYRQKVRERFRLDPEQALPNHSGNLHFFPSYFATTSLEVINPHSRNTGTGSKPILFETVPKNESAILEVLYVPMYGLTNPDLSDAIRDLKLVASGINYMFSYYGLGAKTSGGFGLAQLVNDEAKNRILLNVYDNQTLNLLRGIETDQSGAPDNKEAKPGLNEQSVSKKDKKRRNKKEQLKGFEALAQYKQKLEETADNSPEESGIENVIEVKFGSWETLQEGLGKLGDGLKNKSPKLAKRGGVE